jgi:glucan phosphorylase
VAELHSNILKEELFADYLSIWPNKFQNKTNGITPRRWLRFCNPELSEIVTKWLKTDQWTRNLDLLTGLRKVCVHASDLVFLCYYRSHNHNITENFNSLRMMKNFTLSGQQPSWPAKNA